MKGEMSSTTVELPMDEIWEIRRTLAGDRLIQPQQQWTAA